MRSFRFAVPGLLVLLLVPAMAGAQTLVTGLAVATVDGDVVEPPKKLFGVSGGYWGDMPVGFEVEYAALPDFFPEPHPDADHHVVGDVATLSFNGILGASVRGPREEGFRTYLTGGVVLFDIRAHEAEGLFDVRGIEVGWNIGGGVLALFNEHLGVRGDAGRCGGCTGSICPTGYTAPSSCKSSVPARRRNSCRSSCSAAARRSWRRCQNA